jgi:guanylate kinase
MDESLSQKLSTYRPGPEASKLIKQTPILLLVGPTGAGKDALKDKLLEGGQYHHIVSHTTRPPRINHGIQEQDGLEYHFIDKKRAVQMLEKKEFIEAKGYSGNLYGTSLAEIRAAHDEDKVAMTDIEVQGVAEYKGFDPNVMAVFLLPPDFKTWQERLTRRYGDVVDAQDARQRMLTALEELEQLLNTNYYMAVVNDDLEETFREIEAIAKNHHHDETAEQKARQVAGKLAQDIQAYLGQTA